MKKPNSPTENQPTDQTDVKPTDVSISSKTCGLVMPISAMDGYAESHWIEVKQIVLSVAHEIGLIDCELVSENKSGGLIHGNIVTNLYTKDIVICDVSGKNPNVLFELGLRLAFDKPTIVIKDDETDYMFDTSPIFHLEYPKTLRFASIITFKEKLANLIKSNLKPKPEKDRSFLQHFKIEKVSGIEEVEIPQSNYLDHQLKQIRSMLTDLQYRMNNNIIRNQHISNIPVGEEKIDHIIINMVKADIDNNPDLKLETMAANKSYISFIANELSDKYDLPRTGTIRTRLERKIKELIEMMDIL